MTTYPNQTFTRQTLLVDGNRYVGCTFIDCQLVYEGGELPVFDRCNFQGFSLQLGGPALSTLRYLSGLHAGGVKQPVETVLERIEAGPVKARPQKRFYDPEYTGTNWGSLAWGSLLMFALTVALLAALHYGLQVFPRTQILEGDTVRPLSAQIPLDLMPALPDALAASYDAQRQVQLNQVNTYGWVDPADQIAQIPVDAAMDVLLANGGFPVAGE